VRLTDLIRGAKTVSQDSNRTEQGEEKPLTAVSAPDTTPITPASDLTRPRQAIPLLQTPSPIPVSESDIPAAHTWPSRTLSQPRLEEPVVEIPPAPIAPIPSPQSVVTEPVPSASTSSSQPVRAPIQLRLAQPGPKPSPIKAEESQPSHIQLRALARLTNRAPLASAPEPALLRNLPAKAAAQAFAPVPVVRAVPIAEPTSSAPVEVLPSSPTPIPFVAASQPAPLLANATDIPPVKVDPPQAWVEPTPTPASAPAPASAPDPVPAPVTTRANKPAALQPDWYRLAEVELRRIGELIRNHELFGIEEIQRIAAGMVASMQESDRLLTRAFAADKGAPLIANMVNVGIFSIKLGKGLGYNPDNLIRLAMAGLLHDVGMFLLPETVLMRPGKLNEQEQAAIRKHPEQGQKILSNLGQQYDWLADVAYQEHERSSGRGYPRGLRENQIHEFARVIGLADVFEALLSPRPYRPRMLPHVAMRELLAAERQSFPHQLMKVLVEQFSVFPLGTTVRLNTGEVGIVTKLNPRHPLRPVVQITHLPDRSVPSEHKVVDLSTTTLVHVAVVESETV
jgi:HD-GYP domain-containing protein (c-di-GMP phosphodiesterase class II)